MLVGKRLVGLPTFRVETSNGNAALVVTLCT